MKLSIGVHYVMLPLLLLFIFCSEPGAFSGRLEPGKYVNGFPAFSVTYPESWRIVPGSPFDFRAADPEGVPSIRIVAFPAMGMSMKDYTKLYISMVLQTGKDITVKSDRESKLKNGVVCRESEIEWTNNLGVRRSAFLVTAKEKGIIISVTLSDKGTIGANLKKVAYSLQFEKKAEERAVPVSYQYKIPMQTDDGWETAHLSETGLDEQRLSDLIRRIADGTYKNIHSVLIFKNGKLVLEEYFPDGNDIAAKAIVPPPELHSLMSVTKSFTSTLIGRQRKGTLLTF